MIQNVKQYVLPYISFDEAVPYESLLIHPLTVREYFTLMECKDILEIDKNKIPDVSIIQMSFLQFIATKLFCDNQLIENQSSHTLGEIWQYKFYTLLSSVFKCAITDIKLLVDRTGKISIGILDKILNARQFDDIKKIIMFQNIYDYDDIEMSDDFKKVVNEYYSIKNKNVVAPDINRKMTIITSVTGINRSDLKNMTIIAFENLFHECVARIDYQINKGAELSGNVKFERPIEHWVYYKQRNKYEEAFGSADALKDKINSIN